MGKWVYFVLISVAVISNCIAQEQDGITETDLSVIPLKDDKNNQVTEISNKNITAENGTETKIEESVKTEEDTDVYDEKNEDIDEELDDELPPNDKAVSKPITKIPPPNFKFRFANFIGRIESKVVDVIVDIDKYTTITSENFPNPYPVIDDVAYEWFIKLKTQDDYGVEMIVKTLDLAPNDYLHIKPGKMEQSNERQIVFSHTLASERKYKLFHLDEMYLAFVVNKQPANIHKGFRIDFKGVGILPTTVVPTTTIEPPVTVAPMNQSTIYLGGKTPEEFMNVSDQFRLQLANVATVYCAENNITVDENITISDNVIYHLVTRCTIEWPNSERCVRLVYSIGVSYNNVTDEYELSEKRLDDMWINYRHLFDLTALQLSAYVPPDDGKVLITWVVVSSVIVLVFALLILVTTRFNCFNEYDGRDNIRASLVSEKRSSAYLFPTPHQTVPPFYGMDYYAPEDDQFWSKEDGLAPKFSGGMAGERNQGFVHDDEILDLYSEEIVMSLPDGKEQIKFRMKDSRDKFNGESTL